MHLCLLPTHVAAGPLEQSSRPDAAHGPQIPTLTKKGSFLLGGWWQRRKCSSPEQWARSAVWQCSSADLWDVKSSKWNHPTHVKWTDRLQVCFLTFWFHWVSKPCMGWFLVPLFREILPVSHLNSLYTNMNLTFFGRGHTLVHTPAGISVELLIIPALLSG